MYINFIRNLLLVTYYLHDRHDWYEYFLCWMSITYIYMLFTNTKYVTWNIAIVPSSTDNQLLDVLLVRGIQLWLSTVSVEPTDVNILDTLWIQWLDWVGRVGEPGPTHKWSEKMEKHFSPVTFHNTYMYKSFLW